MDIELRNTTYYPETLMRTLFAFAALAAATPALAASTVMTAVPENGADARIITKGASWNCAGGNCRAASSESRPIILCQRLAKEVGALQSFTADGRAFDADMMAKCNSKAR